MRLSHRPLLDALLARGADAHALDEAVEESERSGRSIRDVLINDRIVTEMELTEASADAHGLNSVDLLGYPFDAAAMAKLPLSLMARHRLIGISMHNDSLVVAVSDPSDVVALDDARVAAGMPIIPVVAARSELRKLIDRLKREQTDLADIASTLPDDDEASTMASVRAEDHDAPVVRYVNSLIEQAIQNRASDLHLEPTENDLRVRFRIDGVLHDIDRVPTSVQSPLISRLKIMANVDITERRVPQNGRITVRLDANKVDLRLATLPTVWGEKIVLRVLDTGGIDLVLRKLGFADATYDRFSASFTKPHGMVLVTGPTGSGKSTTLYATLTEISKPEVNIITVEDPVEYRLPGVNQVQVNHKAGLDFAAVLPAILRSDPDVVLIGEIRDRATAQLGIEAALTGHLVLSTLHTNDAPSRHHPADRDGHRALPGRLVARLRAGPAPGPPAVRLVQGAVRPGRAGAGGRCAGRPTSSRRRSCGGPAAAAPAARPASAAGSPSTRSCRSRRRSSASPSRHASANDIRRQAVAEGMVTLREDGLAKAAAGDTTLEEILRVTV